MTTDELKSKLDSMSAAEVTNFCNDFGGGNQSREQIVRSFVANPGFERQMCQLLGLKTQAQKVEEAAISSAEASRSSAKSARWSMIWALVGVLISIAALIVSVQALRR